MVLIGAHQYLALGCIARIRVVTECNLLKFAGQAI
jgi:hypothetical protein